MTRKLQRHTPYCGLDPETPGCDTGALGRMGFVWREVRTALRTARSARRTIRPGGDLADGSGADQSVPVDPPHHGGTR